MHKFTIYGLQNLKNADFLLYMQNHCFKIGTDPLQTAWVQQHVDYGIESYTCNRQSIQSCRRVNKCQQPGGTDWGRETKNPLCAHIDLEAGREWGMESTCNYCKGINSRIAKLKMIEVEELGTTGWSLPSTWLGAGWLTCKALAASP